MEIFFATTELWLVNRGLRSMRIEAGEEADWLTTTDLTASLGLRLKTVCRAIAAQRSYRKPNVESNYAACTYRPNIGVSQECEWRLWF